MSDVYPADSTGGASYDDDGAARGMARWLGLAAAPTFAIMAILTAARGDGTMATMCSTTPDRLSLSGMVPMYLLMSAFHSAAWLKLLATRLRQINAAH